MPTKQSESAPSFLQVYTQVLRDRMKHSFLRQISACVDWRGIRTLLNKKYTKTQNATGNPAYDALMMFKILLLQTWYGLSDYEVEERINDSLLFSEFLLLDMGLPAPDHSTICRFRAELTRLGIMDKLLKELNKQFKKHGISRIDQGAPGCHYADTLPEGSDEVLLSVHRVQRYGIHPMRASCARSLLGVKPDRSG